MGKIVVAGHICLDITPEIHGRGTDIGDILSPGSLVEVGDADIHTGGVVANTGLAMKILGADVTLAGKTGNDAFGDMISSIVGEYGLADGLIRSSEDSTSYSVVLAIPGVDRIFLHNPGANNTFCADDLPMDAINEAVLFHFGYPPIMRRMYENGGTELAKVMKKAHDADTVTSLDLAAVDPSGEAGRADWKEILKKTLPYVDVFVPSVEELMFMIDRDRYEEIRGREGNIDFTGLIDIDKDVQPLADKCFDMGVKIVLIKCGAPGMYYQTAEEKELGRIGRILDLDLGKWAGMKGFEKSFEPERLLSGTGAGDTSVAAFLTSMVNGESLEKSVCYAAATGACCVASYDALGGLMTFDMIDKKIKEGWNRCS